MSINFATATAAQLEAAGFAFKAMPTTAKYARKSLWGVKKTANKKGIKKAPLAQMNEDSTGLIR
jgi:hypothetical protein